VGSSGLRAEFLDVRFGFLGLCDLEPDGHGENGADDEGLEDPVVLEGPFVREVHDLGSHGVRVGQLTTRHLDE